MAAPTFSAHTTSSITMQWVAPISNGADITNYRLLVQNDSAPAFNWAVESAGGGATSLEVEGLTPGYGYRFAVQAYNGVTKAYDASCLATNGDGWSPVSAWSDPPGAPEHLYAITTPPRAPDPVTVVQAQGKQISVSWQPPFANGAPLLWYTLYTNASECGYMRVRVSPPQVHACNDVVVSAASTTSLTLHALTPHTSYSFTLSANNTAGESPLSEAVVQPTDYHEPEKMSEFVDPPVRGDQYIVVDWGRPVENGLPITRYEVKFRYALGCSPSVPCVIDGFDYADTEARPGGSGWALNDQICAWDNLTQAWCVRPLPPFPPDLHPPCPLHPLLTYLLAGPLPVPAPASIFSARPQHAHQAHALGPVAQPRILLPAARLQRLRPERIAALQLRGLPTLPRRLE